MFPCVLQFFKKQEAIVIFFLWYKNCKENQTQVMVTILNLFLTDFKGWGIKFIRLWHYFCHASDQQTKFYTKQRPWWLLYELGKHCSDFIQENIWGLTLRDGPLQKWWGGGGETKKIQARGNVQTHRKKKVMQRTDLLFHIKTRMNPVCYNNSICTGHTVHVPAAWPQESKAKIRYVLSKLMLLHVLIMHIYALEKKEGKPLRSQFTLLPWAYELRLIMTCQHFVSS